MERDEVRRLWMCQKTVYEVMRDRGYIVNDKDVSMTLEAFVDAYPALVSTGSKHAMSMLFQHVKQSEKQLFVFFPDGSSVSVKDIKIYISMLEEQKISNGIIVCRESSRTRPSRP
jgi:DNA-directed RNA polymerase I, II, and III subunit RPABC1